MIYHKIKPLSHVCFKLLAARRLVVKILKLIDKREHFLKHNVPKNAVKDEKLRSKYFLMMKIDTNIIKFILELGSLKIWNPVFVYGKQDYLKKIQNDDANIINIMGKF